MFRRVVLAMTFIAALGLGGLAMTNTADAWRWGRVYYPYSTYYYGRPVVSYGRGPYYGVPYRTYYGGYCFRRRIYGGPYYGGYYYGPPAYYYRPVPRVALRIGYSASAAEVSTRVA